MVYSYSSGVQVDNNYVQLDVNSKVTLGNEYFKDIGEIDIELIELQANTGVTPFDHDSLVSDTFSDSNGYLNSVDTGNTTATHQTNKFVGTTTFTGSGTKFKDTENATGTYTVSPITMEITVGDTDGFISSIEAWANTNVQLRITDSENNEILNYIVPTGSSNNDTAISASQYKTYMKAGETYTLHFGENGAGFARLGGQSYSGALFSYTNQTILCRENSGITFQTTTETYTENNLVIVNIPSTTGTIIATELIINSPDLGEGETITYNLTDGTNRDEDLSTLVYNQIENLTSNPTKAEISLNKSVGSSVGSPSVKSYSLKVWVQ